MTEREMVKNWSWGEPLLLINICIFGWMASFISGDTDPGDGQYLISSIAFHTTCFPYHSKFLLLQ